jgi:hypothetical protein
MHLKIVNPLGIARFIELRFSILSLKIKFTINYYFNN